MCVCLGIQSEEPSMHKHQQGQDFFDKVRTYLCSCYWVLVCVWFLCSLWCWDCVDHPHFYTHFKDPCPRFECQSTQVRGWQGVCTCLVVWVNRCVAASSMCSCLNTIISLHLDCSNKVCFFEILALTYGPRPYAQGPYGPGPYGPGPLIILKNILRWICSRTIFEIHTAPYIYRKHVPEAVCIPNMVLEHTWLRKLFLIIIGPGPYGPAVYDPGLFGPAPKSRPKFAKNNITLCWKSDPSSKSRLILPTNQHYTRWITVVNLLIYLWHWKNKNKKHLTWCTQYG